MSLFGEVPPGVVLAGTVAHFPKRDVAITEGLIFANRKWNSIILTLTNSERTLKNRWGIPDSRVSNLALPGK